MKSKTGLKFSTQLLLQIELLLIIGFLTLTILELVSTVNMNSHHNSSMRTLFLFIVNNRFVTKNYFSHVKILNDSSQSCGDLYQKQVFYSIQNIRNATFVDVTENTTIIDWKRDPFGMALQNHTYTGKKYYTFEITKQGNESADLLYAYQLDNIGGFNICKKGLNTDTKNQALQIVNVNQTCTDIFPGQKVMDCGAYKAGFRLCILIELLTYEKNKQPVDTQNYEEGQYCPVTYLSLTFENNKEYNPFDPQSKKQNLKLTQIIGNDISKRPELSRFLDNSLVMNFEMTIYLNQHYELSDALMSFPYDDPSFVNTFTIGEKYGFTSQINQEYLQLPFVKLYNDTFYNGSVAFSKDNQLYVSYDPMFMSDAEEVKYYRPIDLTFNENTGEGVYAHFTAYTFPAISNECYLNIFRKENITDIFRFMEKLSIPLYDESSVTLFAWLFAKLFIALWCYIKIRFIIIIEILRLKVSEMDKKSEKLTKYTFKCLSFIVMIILFTSLITQKNTFEYVFKWSDQMVINKCFSEMVTNSIKAYSDFIDQLNEHNNIIYHSVIISCALEGLMILLYLIYDCSNNEPITLTEIESKDSNLKND